MKIGLIAMSGVRAHNEELNKLGLTLPGFVERSKVIASLPSLSLLTLAALTPPHHEVVYFEIADIRTAPQLPQDFDLVAISTFTAQVYDAYQVADSYRALGVPVVMGGLHVSILPDEALDHCTSVVIGEGEALWPRLIEDWECGQLQRRYVQEPYGSYDLAEAPIPRFELLDPDKYNRLTVQTSRGCPHKCNFCASSILLTSRYKLKPTEKVIAEIQAIKQVWDRPFIEFADDNSFVHRAHYKVLLRALCQEEVRWFTETDIAVAKDDELLALMRDSGCRQILVGLESPNTRGLDGVELNANWKLKQQDDYLRAIEKIQSYGITVDGCFILGLDGDTPDVFEEIYGFVKRSGMYDVQLTYMTPFPGTPLYAQLKAEGRLLRDRAWELCTLFDINFIPKNMTVEELQTGALDLGRRIYSEEETAERHGRFR
ncbi:MAG TPA: radical SAM protein, partial [Chthonomonadaceae bacterium]|nr:radical SAM protein [Chthonomonadaceae bacterium]